MAETSPPGPPGPLALPPFVPPALQEAGATAPPPVERGWPALQTALPTYSLRIGSAELGRLMGDLDDKELLVPAEFELEGRKWSVEVRIRGRSTRFVPKKSFQLRFSEADPFLGGRRRLELLAEWADGGYLTEKLWYDLLAAEGVRASTATWVNLELNGRPYGVMTSLERVGEKSFLRGHGFEADSDIYRAGMFDGELRDTPEEEHQRPWIKLTNEAQPWDPLWGFLSRLNRTDPKEFRALVESELDLEGYLRWMAVDAAIANDNVGDARAYLVFEPKLNRWSYVPWDLNNAKSVYHRHQEVDQGVASDRPLKNFTLYDPIAYERADKRRAGEPTMKPVWSVLSTRIMDDEVLRGRMIAALRRLLETRFREEELAPRLQQMQELLAPHLENDPWIDERFAENAPAYLLQFVRERRQWLLDHLHELENHGNSPLKIDRVGRDPNGALFVEILNTSEVEQSLSGMSLTGWLRVPDGAKTPGVHLAPGEHVRLRQQGGSMERLGIAFDPALPETELGLFASDGRTAIDVVFLPRLSPGEVYGRVPRGSENFERIAAP